MKNNEKFTFEYSQINEKFADENYRIAHRKVKKMKGFYIHLLVYVLVNAVILLKRFYLKETGNFWQWQTFSMALYWGIGIVVHGTSVFGKELFFGTNWEERKIKEFMEKEKQTANKWE